ncbi:hypothetical protein ACWCSD_44860 [Nonomuraea sp. NPDC001684]
MGSCVGSGSEVVTVGVGFGETVGVALGVVGATVGPGVALVVPLGLALGTALVGGAGSLVVCSGLLGLWTCVVSSAGGSTWPVLAGSAGRSHTDPATAADTTTAAAIVARAVSVRRRRELPPAGADGMVSGEPGSATGMTPVG